MVLYAILYSNKIVNATQNTIKYDDDQNIKDGNNNNNNSTLDRNN